MSYIDKELKESETEKSILTNKNEVFKNSLTNDLLGGLGDKIIFEIKNPPKTNFIVLKIRKIQNFIKNIFKTL
jgi:hypothetical protein